MSEFIPESRNADAEVFAAPPALGPSLPPLLTPAAAQKDEARSEPVSPLSASHSSLHSPPSTLHLSPVSPTSFATSWSLPFLWLGGGAGLVRNMVIAAQFGIGADLDAYYAAFKLPDLLFTIVAGGALATAFIPVFADFLAEDDRAGAWRLASAITNIVFIVVTASAVLAGILAPWLVRMVIAPGFSPAEQAETVQVMRIVLVSTVIFGVSAVQGSVLNGFKHFLLPALGAALYPLGIAAGAVWRPPWASPAWPSARSLALCTC